MAATASATTTEPSIFVVCPREDVREVEGLLNQFTPEELTTKTDSERIADLEAEVQDLRLCIMHINKTMKSLISTVGKLA
jgi:hypothetical protein